MSTDLVELPPEISEAQEVSEVEYVEANSVEELAEQTHIDDEEVLDRLLLPGRRFGPYRILGFVASGGMGEIYAADRRTDDGKQRHPVALKVISPEHVDDWRLVERFKREASISKAIRSENVIRVYEYGKSEDNKAFLSMELLAGEELFERLCRERTLPLDDLVDLALQVLNGLSAVHHSGFVHRDIKPENIFLARQPDGTEVVKILDFGIAKRREERSDPLLSVAGQIYGTPEYLAPEQANDPDVDPRADIYSLGVMMYEAASGSLPFQGETSYAVIASHQKDPVPALPSAIDPELAEIIYTALAKNPTDRFQSVDEMAQLLGRWKERTSWVEELPGSSELAFDDIFDTADLSPEEVSSVAPHTGETLPVQPTSKREPASSDPIGLDDLADPDFYVDKEGATGSRQRDSRPKPAAKRDRPLDAPADAKGPQRSSEVERKAAHRASVSADDRETDSRVAQMVTWLAIAAILAAVAWTIIQLN